MESSANNTHSYIKSEEKTIPKFLFASNYYLLKCFIQFVDIRFVASTNNEKTEKLLENEFSMFGLLELPVNHSFIVNYYALFELRTMR